jgi:hypothetical protein
LTNELRRIAPQLRCNGLSVTFERPEGKRMIVVRYAGGEESCRQAETASQSGLTSVEKIPQKCRQT